MNTNDWDLRLGDCLDVLKSIPDNSLSSIITDPPYGMSDHSSEDITEALTSWLAGKPYVPSRNMRGFMSAKWDAFVPGPEIWKECLRVLKPGGHLLAFASTRTQDLMGLSIRLAGFDIRGSLIWLHGCLSDDTEILVDGQWVHYLKATQGRHALGYDVVHDTYSWQPIEQLFVYDYDDTAYRIHSEQTDQIVTRNHRVIVGTERGWEFSPAEETARESEIRVPILETVPEMLGEISLQDVIPDTKEQILQKMCVGKYQQFQKGIQKTSLFSTVNDSNSMLSVQKRDVEIQMPYEGGPSPYLFLSMCRGLEGEGVEQTRTQGTGSLGTGGSTVSQNKNVWSQQSGVEGRSDGFQDPRELRGCEVPPMSPRIPFNGEERRVCDGTSIDCSSIDRSMFNQDRNGSSCQSRPYRQSTGESDAIQNERGTQTVRASRFTTTDLARIEPIHYRGIVWCVRVPTGAFVARRNGKVFVTGNSGFPKSQNISKFLDKKAGAVREVIKAPDPVKVSTRKVGQFNSINPSTKGINTAEFIANRGKITAPATEEAKKWDGYGSALKPSHEPIIMARKPFVGSIADNVVEHDTGALNIDGCRIPTSETLGGGGGKLWSHYRDGTEERAEPKPGSSLGRWPSDTVLQHSDECRLVGTREVKGGTAIRHRGVNSGGYGGDIGKLPEGTPDLGYVGADGKETIGDWACVEGCPVRDLDLQSGNLGISKGSSRGSSGLFGGLGGSDDSQGYGDIGGASRFFYCSKASRNERTAGGRVKNEHPTVKSLKLMRWCVRLVTPAGGTILDPFMGSGSTGVAAIQEGFKFIGIEREPKFMKIAKGRIALAKEPGLWDDPIEIETEEKTLEPETPETLDSLLGFE